jgi:hypothetical protein
MKKFFLLASFFAITDAYSQGISEIKLDPKVPLILDNGKNEKYIFIEGSIFKPHFPSQTTYIHIMGLLLLSSDSGDSVTVTTDLVDSKYDEPDYDNNFDYLSQVTVYKKDGGALIHYVYSLTSDKDGFHKTPEFVLSKDEVRKKMGLN